MSAIRAFGLRLELARGDTKVAVCRRHSIGTVQRLNRLLSEYPAPPTKENAAPLLGAAAPAAPEENVAAAAPSPVATLTDAKLADVLAELDIAGWPVGLLLGGRRPLGAASPKVSY